MTQTTGPRLYVGTKIIQAEPQDKANGQPGYKVIYKDGYTSWSPALAFEEAHVALPYGAEKLPPYQQRVMAEKAALDDKISKLVKFMATDVYKALSHDESLLLIAQYEAMYEYSEILRELIELFSSPDAAVKIPSHDEAVVILDDTRLGGR